jgi:hypothetical protein
MGLSQRSRQQAVGTSAAKTSGETACYAEA